MRHRRRQRFIGREITPRRLAAARRALARERANAGLFAEQVAAEQPTPEERISDIDRNMLLSEQRMRDFEAHCWRKGRRMLRSLPRGTQRAILANWNASSCPAEGAYFCDHVWNRARRVLPDFPADDWRPGGPLDREI